MSSLQRVSLMLGIVALVAACQGYPFQYVSEAQGTQISSTNYISGSPATDILFVVDNSPSMADKQNELRANAAAFITAVANANNDYHIGIVTTDLFAATDNGRLRMATAGAPKYMSPQAADVNTIIGNFTDTVGSLGIAGSNAEAGIGGALAALDANGHADAALVNSGFYRSDADLAIIIVTDEDDCTFQTQYAGEQSFWEIATSCYENTTQMQDVNALVKFFTDLKGGNVAKVRAALIGGGSSGQNGNTFKPAGCLAGQDGNVDTACGCWFYSNDSYFCQALNTLDGQQCSSTGSCSDTTCPATPGGSCDVTRCTATASNRYYDFINVLSAQRQAAGLSSGTYMDSICQTDYKQSLLDIAATVVAPSCFSVNASVTTPSDISLQVTHVNAAGGRTAPVTVPRYDPNDTTAQCNSCGNCNANAWQYVNDQVCLVCGTQENTGDAFQVNVFDPNAVQ